MVEWSCCFRYARRLNWIYCVSDGANGNNRDTSRGLSAFTNVYNVDEIWVRRAGKPLHNQVNTLLFLFLFCLRVILSNKSINFCARNIKFNPTFFPLSCLPKTVVFLSIQFIKVDRLSVKFFHYVYRFYWTVFKIDSAI